MVGVAKEVVAMVVIVNLLVVVIVEVAGCHRSYWSSHVCGRFRSSQTSHQGSSR